MQCSDPNQLIKNSHAFSPPLSVCQLDGILGNGSVDVEPRPNNRTTCAAADSDTAPPLSGARSKWQIAEGLALSTSNPPTQSLD